MLTMISKLLLAHCGMTFILTSTIGWLTFWMHYFMIVLRILTIVVLSVFTSGVFGILYFSGKQGYYKLLIQDIVLSYTCHTYPLNICKNFQYMWKREISRYNSVLLMKECWRNCKNTERFLKQYQFNTCTYT